MSFGDMIEILQENNQERVVFVKIGTFYVATGSDAVFLNETLGLKCTCFKKKICKVGFPVCAVEKYLGKLREKNIGYAVYAFSGSQGELIEKYKGDGNYYIKCSKNINCILCMQNKKYNEKDQYMKALKKFLEKEKQKNENR